MVKKEKKRQFYIIQDKKMNNENKKFLKWYGEVSNQEYNGRNFDLVFGNDY